MNRKERNHFAAALGVVLLWMLLTVAQGCGSASSASAGKSEATSGDDDPSMMPMARRVAPAEAPNSEAGLGIAPPSAVPRDVPKLTDVLPEEKSSDGAAQWGTPDAEAGTPLPKRSKPNEASSASFRDGVAALTAGQLDQAKSAFSRSASADGKAAYQAEYALGVIADRQGQPDEALQHYARALQAQPDYEAAVEGTVNILVRRGTPDAAVRFIEPIARQWQRNLHLQALWADTLVRAERVDEAEQVARAALRRDERFVPAIVALAKASQRRGRDELSDSMLEQAREIDPKYAPVHFLQGKRFQAKGELAQALSAYRTAIEINPDYAEARMALGIQSMASGNYAEALTQFEATAKLVPTLVAAHLNLGDAYRAHRRWQEAKREFDKSLRLQTVLPEAHYNLALLYMNVGNEFPNLTELDALGRALVEFNTYRTQMGAKLTPADPSGAYMADTQRRIEREKKRIEREKAKAEKDAQRKARGAGGNTQ